MPFFVFILPIDSALREPGYPPSGILQSGFGVDLITFGEQAGGSIFGREIPPRSDSLEVTSTRGFSDTMRVISAAPGLPPGMTITCSLAISRILYSSRIFIYRTF